MEITEVRIKLVAAKNDKLRAFCSITIDNAFVVRDLKVIEGSKGPFVAMPSRKVMQRCRKCGEKNHHRATYCNDCGGRLPPVSKTPRSDQDGTKLHADIAHPINSECREVVQRRVLESYDEEVVRSKEPGYQPVPEDDEGDHLAPAPGRGGSRLGEYTRAADAGGAAHGEPIADNFRSRPGNFGGTSDWADVPPKDRHSSPLPERGQGRPRSSGRTEPPQEPYRSPSPSTSHEAPISGHPAQPPRPAASLREEFPSEPEDNFGAGLFS